MRRNSQKVVVLSQVPPPFHGSTMMTHNLLATLRGLGYQPELLDRRFSATVGEVGKFSVKKSLSAVLLLARTVFAVLRSRGAPVVFFTTNRSFSLLVDFAIALIFRSLRVPYIAYVHTNGYSAIARKNWIFAMAVRVIFGGSRQVVALGASLISDIQTYCRATISIIPNATPRLTVSKDKPRPPSVIFLSNLLPEKGVEDFMNLALELAGDGQAVFELAGTEVVPNQIDLLRKRVADAGQQSSIMIRGQVIGEDKSQLMARAIALVFPSRYALEAQPLTIIEGFALGVPAFAFDVGGLSDIVIDGETGYLFQIGDTIAMQRALYAYLNDPDAQARMRTNVLRAYEQKHSLESYARSWSTLLADR